MGTRRISKGLFLSIIFILNIYAATGCKMGDRPIEAMKDYSPNRAPVISSITSDFTGSPVPGKVVHIKCDAHDPDDNPLTFRFTSGEGSFTDQADTDSGSTVTFIIGPISGGQSVNITVTINDTKNGKTTRSFNLGKSSPGPVITQINSVRTAVMEEGFSPITFKSGSEGYFQVQVFEDENTAPDIDPGLPLFILNREVEERINIAGPFYIGSEDIKVRLKTGDDKKQKICIVVIDIMQQTSILEYIFTIDSEPPVIESKTPADNESNVTVDSIITINFNEDMDESTINPSTIFINNGDIPVVVTYNNKVATVVPVDNLKKNKRYTVTITDSIKDYAGYRMNGRESWSFITKIGYFFTADDGTTGRELWRSDGTPEGTVMLKDIYPGESWSRLFDLTNVDGTMFFAVNNDAEGRELWKSDGTSDGTILVKDICIGCASLSYDLVDVNGILFFSVLMKTEVGIGSMWKSNGTPEGTVLIKNFPSLGVPRFNNHINVNGTLFFTCVGNNDGVELCKSDGTEDGTVIVRDIYPNDNSSNPSGFANMNGTLFFSADDGINGRELWRSDGTQSGTTLVKDIYAGIDGSSLEYFVNVNGILFFPADDGINGIELWKSDGTEGGTIMVKDINSGGNSFLYSSMIGINGILYFTATDGTNGNELWRSDGTEDGTYMVKDINPSDSSPSNFINLNGKLYFTADDGTNGRELWRSDGTENGTYLVKDIAPGNSSSNPDNFCVKADEILFFSADDGVHGKELWISDGTPAGTVMLKDINNNSAGSFGNGE